MTQALSTPGRSKAKQREQAGAIAAAALLLPGLCPKLALAENAPEQGVVSVKYLYYKDSQPGLDRITVNAPSLYLLTPFAGQWSLEGSLVSDAVSGATPRFYSAVSGATKYNSATGTPGMKDERKAGDAKITRYFERASVSASVAYSDENDFTGRAVSVGGSWATADNNTTFNLGVGASSDKISSEGGGRYGEKAKDKTRKGNEFLIGVTQILSPRDIVQVNLTTTRGRGYFDDPYKFADKRPDKRNATILLARWNHHIDAVDTTLRASFRYYDDSYGVRSQTYGVEAVKSLGHGWTLTPGLRFYSQSSASFYFDPVRDSVTGDYFPPPNVNYGVDLFSADQRLAAFGAVTAGFKVSKDIGKLWSIDGKAEFYRQKSSWRIGGEGSPGIDTFDAQFWQLGVSRKF